MKHSRNKSRKKSMLRCLLPCTLLFVIAGCSSIEKQQTLITATLKQQAEQYTGECNSPADTDQTQYIIGYGSLMQEASRKRTAPNADTAYPVEVTGFQRGWFAKGSDTGFSTTFLGVVPDENSQLNAVIFAISPEELLVMDKRESGYCRSPVNANTVHLYGKGGKLPEGQYWIYSNSSNSISMADINHPLVQSYVDIFIGGCLEQEERYSLKGFAETCINTTKHWSANWVNDRVHPRRPFAQQPQAGKIDALLNTNLPELFQKITLE